MFVSGEFVATCIFDHLFVINFIFGRDFLIHFVIIKICIMKIILRLLLDFIRLRYWNQSFFDIMITDYDTSKNDILWIDQTGSWHIYVISGRQGWLYWILKNFLAMKSVFALLFLQIWQDILDWIIYLSISNHTQLFWGSLFYLHFPVVIDVIRHFS